MLDVACSTVLDSMGQGCCHACSARHQRLATIEPKPKCVQKHTHPGHTRCTCSLRLSRSCSWQ